VILGWWLFLISEVPLYTLNWRKRGRSFPSKSHACHRTTPFITSLQRGTSLIRHRAPLGPCSRTLPRAPRWSRGGGRFLASELSLYTLNWRGGTQRATGACRDEPGTAASCYRGALLIRITPPHLGPP